MAFMDLMAAVLFHPANWHFSKEERLTIRAEACQTMQNGTREKCPCDRVNLPLNFKPYGNEDPFKGAS